VIELRIAEELARTNRVAAPAAARKRRSNITSPAAHFKFVVVLGWDTVRGIQSRASTAHREADYRTQAIPANYGLANGS